MRLRKGCRRCRERHTKCRVDPGATACHTCLQSNNECQFEPNFQFRSAWDDDDDKAADTSWTDDQTWVPTSAPLRYVFEDGTGLQTEPTWSPESFTVCTPSSTTGPVHTPSVFPVAFQQQHSPVSRRLSISRLLDSKPSSGYGRKPPSFGSSDSFTTSSVSQNHLPVRPPRHLLKPDLREAHLLHAYGQLLAPWCDSNDGRSTFQNEVPCRALQNRMLFYAIMALTSLHEALMTRSSRFESEDYHDKCLPLVINALSAKDANDDVDLLVTISVLRQYEELNDLDDSPTHLTGANQMLSEVSRFASSGGVAEAASWQTLRQLITAAIVQRHPLQISLDDYERSSIATSRENGPYANCAVLLCAKALQLKDVGWAELETSIERWWDERPLPFEPIYRAEPDPANGKPWPTLPMLGEAQVMGYQYYFISKILVLCHKPSLVLSGFEGMKKQARIEKQVRLNLLSVMGLAVSNDKFNGAKFGACHMLNLCGYCLNTTLQRQHALAFLDHVTSIMGWQTRRTTRLLEEQWAELDTTDVYD